MVLTLLRPVKSIQRSSYFFFFAAPRFVPRFADFFLAAASIFRMASFQQINVSVRGHRAASDAKQRGVPVRTTLMTQRAV